MSLKSLVLRRLAVRSGVSYGSGLHVGPGSVVWAPTSLVIGADVYVGKHVTIEVDGVIGDGVLIANAVGIVGRTDHDMREVGKTVRRSRWVGEDAASLSKPVRIGSDVWIGYGAIVLSGVTIGDGAVVGAGSVVSADIPANSIAVGSPARVIGKRFDADQLAAHWDALEARGVRRICG